LVQVLVQLSVPESAEQLESVLEPVVQVVQAQGQHRE
jgi:hypothetical protein